MKAPTVSRSRKLVSATISRDSDTLIKRGASTRPIEDSDFRYLWAAYRLGLWRDNLDGELSRDAFLQRTLEIISATDYDWIVVARQAEGMRPVGLVLAAAMADGRRIEPHIDWFPWATPRNKLEGSAAFLRQVSKQFKILVYVREAERGFWDRLKQYRLLRSGCKVIDHFSRGKHAFFFYTVGP